MSDDKIVFTNMMNDEVSAPKTPMKVQLDNALESIVFAQKTFIISAGILAIFFFVMWSLVFEAGRDDRIKDIFKHELKNAIVAEIPKTNEAALRKEIKDLTRTNEELNAKIKALETDLKGFRTQALK